MKVKMLDQVTNAEWKRFKPEHKFTPGQENKPVVNVTFNEGMEYARWLSQTTGRKFRLPTEEERKAAEATFKADFSSHPLKEVPDVGTFGRNEDGVTGLLGTTYDWCADPEDIRNPEDLGWVSPSKSHEPTTLVDLRKTREDLDAKIQAAEAALKVLSDLGVKP